jgi:hypothetical protein
MFSDHLARIKQEVRDGTYRVDPAAIAGAMVARGERALAGEKVYNGHRDRAAMLRRMAHARAAPRKRRAA